MNAASKWAQEIAELNLAAVATPFYKGYKVLLSFLHSSIVAPSFVHGIVHPVAAESFYVLLVQVVQFVLVGASGAEPTVMA